MRISLSESQFLAAFNALLPKARRIDLVKEVLDKGSKDLGSPAHRFYKKAIDQGIVRGFRPGSKPPLSALTNAIASATQKSVAAMWDFLLAWRGVHHDLAELVIDHLADNPYGANETPEDFKGSDAADLLSVVYQVADAIIDKNEDYNRDEVALMVASLALARSASEVAKADSKCDQQPDSEVAAGLSEPTEPEGQDADLDPNWRQILDCISNWPSTSKAFDHVSGFVQALERIAAGKLEERTASRDILRDSIARLCDDAHSMISYFNMQSVHSWSEASPADEQVAAVVADVDGLRSVLIEYAELVNAKTLSLEQLRQLRIKQQEIEDECLNIYWRLDPILSTPHCDHPGPGSTHAPDLANGGEDSAGSSGEDVGIDADVDEEGDDILPHPQSSAGAALPEHDAPSGTLADVDEAPPADYQESEGTETEPPRTEHADEQVEEIKAKEADYTESTPSAHLHDTRVELPPLPETYRSDEDAVWSLVRAYDIPGAYWLARSLEEQGLRSPVPSKLLAAVQSAHWAGAGGRVFTNQLSVIAADYSPLADATKTNDVPTILALSAAIIPVLTNPGCGMLHWIQEPRVTHHLRQMSDAVLAIANYAIPVTSASLQGLQDRRYLANRIRAVTHEARQWMEESKIQTAVFGLATKVLRSLFTEGGRMHTVLDIIVHSRRDQVHRVKEEIEFWSSRQSALSEANRIARSFTFRKTGKVSEITGDARDKLLHAIDRTCDLGKTWCSLVEYDSGLSARQDWYQRLIDGFREKISALRDGIAAELRDPELSGLPMSAAALCLSASVACLFDLIHVDRHPDWMELPRAHVPSADWWTRDAGSLEESLGKRLLWVPGVRLQDTCEPEPVWESAVYETLTSPEACELSPSDAFAAYLEKKDYRFIGLFQAAMGTVDGDTGDTYDCETQMANARQELSSKLRETDEAIERALINGVISEEERSYYSSITSNINPEETLKVGEKLQELADLRNRLRAAVDERLQGLSQKWQALKPELRGRPNDQEWEAVCEFLERRFAERDTRVIDEYLSKLESPRIADLGTYPADLGTRPKDTSADLLTNYTRLGPLIESELERNQGFRRLLTCLANGANWGPLRISGMPRKQTDQSLKAMKCWQQLKMLQPAKTEDSRVVGCLKPILSFLGFNLDVSERLDAASMTVVDVQTLLVHVRARMSASDLARPFPQFGSMAQECYDVVCLWERPGADAIGSLLHDSRLDFKNPIVIYLGRLSEQRQKELTRICRRRRLGMAVLDELLAVYLTGERDIRLPTFLRCSLPFSAVIPYIPQSRGDVPPEIFYGRDDMVKELMRMEGSCLVYGGRQMGKSALLRHVRRQFHRPETKHYAWVEDIMVVGDPLTGETSESLWDRIHAIFVQLGLLKRSNTSRIDTIARQVREVMASDPDLRVLLMFDEADKFLNQDAQNNFPVVSELRAIMSESSRRFKVVFAGLHHVQRFDSLPNQPLAHFGTPLLVGPLESQAAVALVTEPLEALGCTLGEGCVLRILSYTNYHPGLIQHFCSELLKRLYGSTPTGHRHTITNGSVESVYLNPEVRDEIRDRFTWTLNLDPRYQVIAWSMIIDQQCMKDGYSKTYSARELKELASQWWEPEFVDLRSDEFRSLLSEMRGLGVLVVDPNQRYRLRSPNLVRLMGSERDIEDQLLEFAGRSSIERDRADSFHAMIDSENKIYSPFTFAQERALTANETSVRIITASPALGYDHLELAIKRLARRGTAQTDLANAVRIPIGISTASELDRWLLKRLDRGRSSGRTPLSAYEIVRTDTCDPCERIARALSVCDRWRKERKNQILRIYIVLDGDAYWRWISHDRDLASNLDEQGFVVPVQKWNLDSVSQRLDQLGKLNSTPVCEVVMEITGGWPILLDSLFHECGTSDNPKSTARSIAGQLRDKGSNLHSSFIAGLQIPDSAPVKLVLRSILSAGDVVPVEYINPKQIEGGQDLTDDSCSLALSLLLQLGVVDQSDGGVKCDPVVSRLMEA